MSIVTSSGCGNVSSVSNNTITNIGKQTRTPYLYKYYVYILIYMLLDTT